MWEPDRVPNPDLTVGADNKQRWNQPAHRRHGFHNAHRLFRRALTVRARRPVVLTPAEDARIAAMPEVATLTGRPEFSGLVCARQGEILLGRHAADFPEDQPHSIQSVTKLMMHLVAGRMVAEGWLDPARPVEHYLPEIGSGYRGATVQDVLDMNVMNDFSEDYDDPEAECYTEEIALGWRLPEGDAPEVSMLDVVTGVTGDDVRNHADTVNYCSANTDLLTLICDRCRPGALPKLVEEIADDAGVAGALHMSLSPEGLPAFAGGGCLSAADLARFGLLLARVAKGAPGMAWNAGFTQAVIGGAGKPLPAPRDFVRYAHQMMSNGRWIGHAGYGGQFLLIDPESGLSCAYLSVLENESGYDEDYMAETILCLQSIAEAVAKG
ncbi:serine hydrolase [Roseovarius indicus]|uniref:serine hydrolase n=1 Tax=Roseovarius indicus TaxID=540747 RepID=UPI0007D8D0AB|nr:serine hydrolase domain-containing protein [Roseovarius indicus]OAO08857.1 hypothetical protein A8B76_11670 [Roseovarius indicus]